MGELKFTPKNEFLFLISIYDKNNFEILNATPRVNLRGEFP